MKIARQLALLSFLVVVAWATLQVTATLRPHISTRGTPAWADGGSNGNERDGRAERSGRDDPDGRAERSGREDPDGREGRGERDGEPPAGGGGATDPGELGSTSTGSGPADPASVSGGAARSSSGGTGTAGGHGTPPISAARPNALLDPKPGIQALSGIPSDPPVAAGIPSLPEVVARWIGYVMAGTLIVVFVLLAAGLWAKRKILKL
jgi:hypothetical protein